MGIRLIPILLRSDNMTSCQKMHCRSFFQLLISFTSVPQAPKVFTGVYKHENTTTIYREMREKCGLLKCTFKKHINPLSFVNTPTRLPSLLFHFFQVVTNYDTGTSISKNFSRNRWWLQYCVLIALFSAVMHFLSARHWSYIDILYHLSCFSPRETCKNRFNMSFRLIFPSWEKNGKSMYWTKVCPVNI